MSVAKLVFTNKAKEIEAKIIAGDVSYTGNLLPVGARYFKVGTGGHIGTSPKEPDPTLTDLEEPVLQKDLDSVIYSFTGGLNVITCVAFLDTTEANGYTLYEIGIFDQQDNMIAYGTFPAINKTASKNETFTAVIQF